MTHPEIILRQGSGNDIELCPGCHRNAVENDGSWEAFLADGDPTAPLCMVCVSNLDDRFRIALDILNYSHARVRLQPGEEPPF